MMPAFRRRMIKIIEYYRILRNDEKVISTKKQKHSTKAFIS